MIRTVNQITANDGQVNKLTKVTCFIKFVTFVKGEGIIIGYVYLDENGNKLPVKKDTFEIPSADIQPVYDAVSSGLPDVNVDYDGHNWGAFYKAAKLEMVKTFADLTSVTEIEDI